MNERQRQFLTGLFRIAVDAAHPAASLPALLPPPPKGRLIVLAAGKAAGSMAEVAEGFYLDKHKMPRWLATATAGPGGS
jgi:glycerate 2-kinase